MLRARPRPRSRTRVHDCELHIGFPQWRPRLDPNGAPLGRYMTTIDLRQFPHHRHHVTHHAEWGGGANEHALHPKVEPPRWVGTENGLRIPVNCSELIRASYVAIASVEENPRPQPVLH